MQAEDGVGLPEEILEGSSFEKAAHLYFMFIRFDFLWSLNYLALVVLNFLEKPLWCSKHLAESCNNRDYYYLGELPYLTGAESLIYEVSFCMAGLIVKYESLIGVCEEANQNYQWFRIFPNTANFIGFGRHQV
ncbi:two pore calcium channel protein 1B-like [Lycium barbarum]|uniref:two pore calcium channel protein 1B-like n=1 Tax=Lycium barbarum TaxID=112863 RepID=UPI00293E79BC|nr:two pore calcium channel protein 1B-like [Lycium barbarum]